MDWLKELIKRFRFTGDVPLALILLGFIILIFALFKFYELKFGFLGFVMIVFGSYLSYLEYTSK